MERADFIARTIEAANRLEAMPIAYAGATNGWESAIAAAGAYEVFEEIYDQATQQSVVDYLAFSPANPIVLNSRLPDLPTTPARGRRADGSRTARTDALGLDLGG